MEIAEVVYGLIQGCGCLLEVLAGTSSVGAGVAGVKASKQRKIRKESEARGAEPPRNRAALWFVLLLVAAVFSLGLVAFKYLR